MRKKVSYTGDECSNVKVLKILVIVGDIIRIFAVRFWKVLLFL